MYALFTLAMLSWAGLHSFAATISQHHTSPENVTFTIACRLEQNEMLLHNSINFSSNSPQVTITEWHAEKTPFTFFDTASKKSQPAYSDHITFIVTAKTPADLPFAGIKLHMQYQTNMQAAPSEKIFSLGSVDNQTKPEITDTTPESATTHKESVPLMHKFNQFSQSLLSSIQDKELPLALKFLLALLIGILMSLTPCIYPMIPITIGLLHGNKKQTFGRSFSLALVYTFGISFTFALLGFLAAFAGAQFGSLMSNPWVIVPIVLFFGYLGFSMLGFYDMYTPSFMRARGVKHEGSYVSAFVFGLINGTVASPCLSPGLALILGIVAQMANKFLGFLLLFVFGIGSSLPLLIIGTFSSALNVLPRAGMWMIEFKKVFGFMLLGMCLFYLKIFMPSEDVFYIVMGIYLILVGIYYFMYGLKHHSSLAKLVAVVLFVASALSFIECGKCNLVPSGTPFPWGTGYIELREKARAEGKPMLLDFTTSWCSACKMVDKQFFGLPAIQKELPKRVVAIKVDCSDLKNETHMALAKKFAVTGYPTFLLVDPVTETVIRTWYADIVEKTPEEFFKQLTP